MNDLPPEQPPAEPAEATESRSAQLPLALVWTFILFFVLVTAGINFVGSSLIAPTEKERQLFERLEDLSHTVTGRSLVGFKAMGIDVPAPSELAEGPLSQRLRYAILVGELQGGQEASAALASLGEAELDDLGFNRREKELQGILTLVYDDISSGRLSLPNITAEQEETLRADLGWFGELALTPPGRDPSAREDLVARARRTGAFVLAALVGVLALGAACLFALLYFASRLFQGRLEIGLSRGSLFGGIYAETFGLWLMLFLFLGLVIGVFASLVGGSGLQLPASAAASLLSLSALLWPRIRGVPWSTIRTEIGWTQGRGLHIEPLYGVASYLIALPIFATGLLITQLLVGWFASGPEAAPSHPIVVTLAEASGLELVLVFFVVGVVAPLVEETMFRGVLYRHLRELPFAPKASVIFSATVSSLIFACIHPQGLLAVPVLAATSASFVLAREWRGTLVPAMVAHGVHNTATLGLLLLLLRYA